MQSNDTGVTVGYGFGVFAGKGKELSLELLREQTTIAFDLNKSAVGVSWQDVILSYRLGFFRLGVTISSSAWKVSAPPDTDGDGVLDNGATVVAQDLLDVTTTGYGGNAGFQTAINKRSTIYVNATYVTSPNIQEKVVKDPTATPILDRVIAVGPRMDVDIGGTIKLLKWLDLRAGFKYRTYQLTIDGTTSAEGLNTTYAGLTAGLSL